MGIRNDTSHSHGLYYDEKMVSTAIAAALIIS